MPTGYVNTANLDRHCVQRSGQSTALHDRQLIGRKWLYLQHDKTDKCTFIKTTTTTCLTTLCSLSQ